MIDRFTITASATKIAERFSVEVPDFYTPKYNAAPTQLIGVITSNAPEGLSNFYWGTSPEWAKNKTLSEKIINVRAEVILEKPAIKRSMMRGRCIVPADGFYAWKKAGKKSMIPYRFVDKNEGIFSFAAIWEEFEDTDGNELQTFSIITVPANELVTPIYDRMPVILSPETEAQWLNKETKEEELVSVLTAIPANQLNLYSISPRISNPALDVPSLIHPTPPADQHGNLTLFD
ncbi:SOS response-associated peptidase [Pseudochryseolinea flava]|uniref:Abasic site processing protein n=1 Tax=Pseudochryseolinea flava TaxID=2059302 RepID=A0A364XX81_9BACT|nr:SOS response-associated peptidase [Pseudochryseolinea flava]RAV98596.1 SOS response-associated peptidase [Pseudochryseolinea flava]